MPLSPLTRFGTSTWTYEGWRWQVYLKQYAKSTFARECLGEYCQYLHNGEPCFRTVGNDATFYQPPTPNQLRKYLNQIPEDFEMCFKVWEELTIPSYAKHARYGTKAGQPNPHFLNAKIFNNLVLTPYREVKFEPHTGLSSSSFNDTACRLRSSAHASIRSLAKSRRTSCTPSKFEMPDLSAQSIVKS